MDCKEFRNNHALLIDTRCSAVEEAEMRAHMASCPPCAHHDMIIRRSLLLVRNLPTIEPSPDFRARLDARLRLVAQEHGPSIAPRSRPAFVTFTAVAAGLLLVAFIGTNVLRKSAPVEIRMAPVVATIPEHAAPSPAATSALVATVPTGMSVWPAIMVANQAPMHFVAAELASER